MIDYVPQARCLNNFVQRYHCAAYVRTTVVQKLRVRLGVYNEPLHLRFVPGLITWSSWPHTRYGTADVKAFGSGNNDRRVELCT